MFCGNCASWAPGGVPGFRMKSIIALVSLFLFAACANVETAKDAALVGNWLADDVQSCRYRSNQTELSGAKFS
jgi:hypothetical protein